MSDTTKPPKVYTFTPTAEMTADAMREEANKLTIDISDITWQLNDDKENEFSASMEWREKAQVARRFKARRLEALKFDIEMRGAEQPKLDVGEIARLRRCNERYIAFVNVVTMQLGPERVAEYWGMALTEGEA